MKKALVTAGVAAAALALSACGSGSGSGVAEGSDSAGLKGKPLDVMVFGSFSQPPFPLVQIKTAAEAAATSINDDGGVDGRPINIIPCDDQGSANGATACGKKAVDDGVLAVVGAFTLFGDNIVPQLQAASIPYLLPTAVSQQESTSPVSFPVFSATGPTAAALYDLEKNQLCDTAGIIAVESASADNAFKNFFEPLATGIGIPVKNVTFSGTTTDFTGVAVKTTDETDCGLYGTGTQQAVGILNAVAQGGHKYTNVMGSTLVLPEKTLDQLGDAGNGILTYSNFYFPSTGKKAVEEAVSNMKAKDSAVVIDETALNSYAGVVAFSEVAKKLGKSITAKSIVKKLKTKGTVIDTGLFPPVDFGSDSGYFKLNPRTAGSVFQRYVARDGVYEPDGEPFDVAGKLG